MKHIQPPGVETDLYISSVTFILTAIAWKIVQDICEANLHKWEQFPRSLRDRFCSEVAIIPVRFALGYVTFSLVCKAFEPAQTWGQAETEAALTAW
jgi:hypothetical protein